MKIEKQTILVIKEENKENWAKYNLAKTSEKRLFYELLKQLTKTVIEPRQQMGRPTIPIKDLIFCAGLKLYSNYSGRKAVSDYRLAREGGYISRVPHFNTLKDFLNCNATYDLLKRLLTITAMPLRSLEDKYSLDSSGFGSYQFERWRRIKEDPRQHRNYLKGHILIGTRTNVICNCEITPGNFSDARQAPQIILEASNNFKIKEFSGDKGYSSKLVFRILESINAMSYVPFKRTTRQPEDKDLWAKMYNLFKNNQEEWARHYHIRSNVEATFSMIKRKFGEILLSKNYIAQRNELMMKFICHNICCLVEESIKFNIGIDFSREAYFLVERKVPSELITRDASKVQNEDF